jgi:hypothetical protein
MVFSCSLFALTNRMTVIVSKQNKLTGNARYENKGDSETVKIIYILSLI